MTSPRHQFVAIAVALAIGLLLGAELPMDDQMVVGDAQPVPTRMAVAGYNGGQLVVESALARRPRGAVAAGYDRYSSNGDPAFDAPDPFGAASHGMDLVEGARLTSIPVPSSGEPLGAIPLL